MWDWLLLGHRILALVLVACMLLRVLALWRRAPASAAAPDITPAFRRLRAVASVLVIGFAWVSVLVVALGHPALDHRLLGRIDWAAVLTIGWLWLIDVRTAREKVDLSTLMVLMLIYAALAVISGVVEVVLYVLAGVS